ncbi:tRNA (N6-isopentenyl adenosine(37)-C2)-methylthiotransferase MiaB [Oxalobacter vibrioformis]|uniref:tRNA-2-methylthio-N(6)-dimethylallyladenosine synthase n=1 Tax=Oxalobacter vibrioformis TaxID=933080 RepID=A0A9E9LUU3_9BURK|nr:tRNA (N6-isopentenyl adenosine(37)-C2)-methylthiotransferase MiaB [Oxalobacter vibrioformis]WAW09576.1 tRNA (N6-isopentenyl adenosine(37)-C2)-methylthiotransferase MiaB [Oxalobacter vibrioformis]
MQKKVFIRTFGCQMNEYDSARMLDLLEAESGYARAESPEDADLILLNTCSVREKAQEKVFSDLGRIRKLKNARPGLLIGVSGCVASQEGETIIRRAPYVNLVFGPQTFHRLPAMIKAYERTGSPQVDISFPEIEKFDHLPPAKVEVPVASVTIMEGCSHFCSYCIVPYTRGKEISRPLEDILVEIAGLADQGVKEILLLGQNVNAWRGIMDGGEKADFALLVEYIADIPGIERIRFVTSHPTEFSHRLIEAYSRVPKLVSHLYLPAQHGSDRILAAMKRGYTTLEYKSIIRRLKAIRPDLLVSSDFIVGFPGETDADFEAMMRFIDEIGFDNSFSFLYSPRPGTPAAALPMDIPLDVRKERLQRLQAKIDEHTRRYNAALVDTTQRVLIEGRSQKNPGQFQGKTGSNRVVHITVKDTSPVAIGDFADIYITDATNYALRGIPAADRIVA